MTELIPLTIAVPLIGAALTAIFARSRPFQRAVNLASAGTMFTLALLLVFETSDGGTVAAQVGGWPAPFAIPLAADLFSSLMLLVGSAMILASTWFAIVTREDEGPLFHPLVMILAAGVAGAFLTADLFNLYVMFEVMLIASYVLMTLGGSKERVRAGVIYVTVNLLASIVLIAAVALSYAVAGGVQFGVLREAAGTGAAMAIPGALLLVAFGTKASLVPVHNWLPRTYPTAPPAVNALFSGLLTKVGIYALYRVYAVVFDGDPSAQSLLLGIAAATMVIGVLGAVGRNTMREILSFHMVSQVGYMVMGLGLFGALGLAAGIFYMLQYIAVKTALFLVAGAIEANEGTGDLDRLSGLARREPILAIGFAIPALALAGLPPLSGFFGKLLLVRAAFTDAQYAIGAVALFVSVLTLLSMLKIWNNVFWGPTLPGGEAPAATSRAGTLAAPALVLAAIPVLGGVFAEGLLTLSTRAGEALVDVSRYVQAVMGG